MYYLNIEIILIMNCKVIYHLWLLIDYIPLLNGSRVTWLHMSIMYPIFSQTNDLFITIIWSLKHDIIMCLEFHIYLITVGLIMVIYQNLPPTFHSNYNVLKNVITFICNFNFEIWHVLITLNNKNNNKTNCSKGAFLISNIY